MKSRLGAVAVWCAVGLAGCYEWQPAATPPAPVDRVTDRTVLRLTTRHGSEILLRRHAVVGDSIFGERVIDLYAKPNPPGVGPDPWTAVALAQIEKTEARHLNRFNSVLAIGGILSVTAVVAGYIIVGSNVAGLR